MKTQKKLLIPLLLLLLLASACGLSQDPGPTGIPKGKIGHAMVCVNGTVYIQDIYDETLHYPDIPGGCTPCGTVEAAADSAIPTEGLHAALVDVGAALYLADDGAYLYVRTDNGTENGSIRRFIPLKESPLANTYAEFDGAK